MAERKAVYTDILRHYYRGTRLMIIAERTRPAAGESLFGTGRSPLSGSVKMCVVKKTRHRFMMAR